MGKVRVLMVCTANICRSAMAEGIMKHRLKELGLQRKIRVDSAGTRASQPGHKPDARAQRLMEKAGMTVRGIKARQVRVKDIVRSDYILAMDGSNYSDLVKLAPQEHHQKIKLLMSYVPELDEDEVPDPYYGNASGFEAVFRLVDTSVSSLINSIISPKG